MSAQIIKFPVRAIVRQKPRAGTKPDPTQLQSFRGGLDKALILEIKNGPKHLGRVFICRTGHILAWSADWSTPIAHTSIYTAVKAVRAG